MIKLLAELLVAISLLILPSSANTAETAQAEPAAISVLSDDCEVYSHQSEGVMLARFENILNHNHCFGEDFQSADRLVLGAQLSLAELCDDGYIPAAAVNEFVFNMYGKNAEGTVLECDDQREGFYPVLPRGFDTYRHTVTDYSYVGDGRITVTSSVLINPDGEAQQALCESVFFADGSSAFGYTLLECNIY